MANSISFVGRIGQEPELKDVGSNTVLEFSAASDVGWGDRKVTNWFRCSMWGKRGQNLKQHLTKGKQVFITGELSLRKFTDRDGNERLSPEVNVNQLDFVSGGQDRPMDGGSAPAPQAAPATPATDDDMPF